MVIFVVLLALGGVFYAYFGYPLALMCLIRRNGGRPLRADSNSAPKSLSLVIAARNEEKTIREKLENSFAAIEALHAKHPIESEVIVASDCSDDRTDGIVQEYQVRGAILSRSPERGGKEVAQKLAVSRSHGEVIFFTDAKVFLDRDALANCFQYFLDPTVGAVSSIDKVEGAHGSGEGAYVRYEMWLRRLETQYSTIVGLSGSGFAVRREIASGLREDVPSDFVLMLETVRRGFRGVLGEDVVCRYKAVPTEEAEFGRKVRTVLRGITALFTCREVLDPQRFGMFAWQVFSHKLCRWLVPFFLLFALAVSLLWAPTSAFLGLIAFGLSLFFIAAGIAYKFPELRSYSFFKVPLYFTVSNAAIAKAWWKYFSGARSVVWTPSAKGEA